MSHLMLLLHDGWSCLQLIWIPCLYTWYFWLLLFLELAAGFFKSPGCGSHAAKCHSLITSFCRAGLLLQTDGFIPPPQRWNNLDPLWPLCDFNTEQWGVTGPFKVPVCKKLWWIHLLLKLFAHYSIIFLLWSLSRSIQRQTQYCIIYCLQSAPQIIKQQNFHVCVW